MDSKVELYLGRRYVAVMYSLIAIIGLVSTKFFGSGPGFFLISEILILIIGLTIVVYILQNRNNKSLKALRMQNKIVLALLLIALAFQGINIIEKLNTPIFSDMLASTMGFVLVILNMVSGSPSRSYMSRYLPESAKQRAWMYIILFRLFTDVANTNQNIADPSEYIVPLLLFVISLIIFLLLIMKSLASRKKAERRDKYIVALLVISTALLLFEMFAIRISSARMFEDVAGLVIIGLMLFTAMM